MEYYLYEDPFFLNTRDDLFLFICKGTVPSVIIMINVVNKLAENPEIFIILRKLIESNFTGEKNVLKNELSNINADSRILDLGCGTGEFSVFFQGFDYTGIDIESNYIDYAKKNYDGQFELMDASHMLFEDNTFDIIVVFGVFHHINNEICLQIFDEMNRVLKKNGRIIIMEDVDVESKLDILGNILRKYDKGNYIRKKNEYLQLFKQKFKISNNYRIRSGLVTYEVIII